MQTAPSQDNPSPQRALPAQDGRAQASAEKLERSAGAIEQSAGAVEESAEQLTDSADRRTELASNRTMFAAERTYAAWMRTGLAALASGVGARALLEGLVPGWMVGATGSLLILFSAFCFVAAVWRQLRPGASPPHPDVPRLPSALLIVINGFLMCVAVTAMFAMWSGDIADR